VVSPDQVGKLTEQVREARARVRRQVADSHRRVAEVEHGTEELMLQVADRLPSGQRVREHAHGISENADRHLRQAEREDEGD
jgi:hypothetical protein